MKFSLMKAFVLVGSFALVNCAETPVAKQIDKEVVNEPAHTQKGELARKGYQAVENSNLSAEQKLKITHLIDQAHKESVKLTEEDSKLKGVLIETITATPYKTAKVDELKARLRKVSDEKLKNTMHAIREVQKVVGVATASKDHEEIYRELLFERPGARELE